MDNMAFFICAPPINPEIDRHLIKPAISPSSAISKHRGKEFFPQLAVCSAGAPLLGVDHKVVMVRNLGAVPAENFPEQPFDAVPHHRSPDLAGDRDAEPVVLKVVFPSVKHEPLSLQPFPSAV